MVIPRPESSVNLPIGYLGVVNTGQLSPSATPASPVSSLIVGLVLAGVGLILGIDIKGISSAFHRNSSRFTPWGRDRNLLRGVNPFKLVGWVFVGVAVVFLVGAAGGFA